MLVESMKVTKEPEVEHKLTYGEMRSRAEKIEDKKIKERVLTGLLLLQERWGDEWADHIDLRTLDMGNGSYCVLGQLYGSYMTGLSSLGINSGRDFGFDVNRKFSARSYVEYDALDVAWKSVLA